jgi:hypothetical protein
VTLFLNTNQLLINYLLNNNLDTGSTIAYQSLRMSHYRQKYKRLRNMQGYL